LYDPSIRVLQGNHKRWRGKSRGIRKVVFSVTQSTSFSGLRVLEGNQRSSRDLNVEEIREEEKRSYLITTGSMSSGGKSGKLPE